MRYLDKYPHCLGCPVEIYCGTMVSSIRLCNSYNNKEKQDELEEEILEEIGCMDIEDLNY